MTQPDPRPGLADVWPLVIGDMQARDQLGRQRYGTPLQTGNGRDALQDAYEEALDLSVYLRQAIEERKSALSIKPEHFRVLEALAVSLLYGLATMPDKSIHLPAATAEVFGEWLRDWAPTLPEAADYLVDIAASTRRPYRDAKQVTRVAAPRRNP